MNEICVPAKFRETIKEIKKMNALKCKDAVYNSASYCCKKKSKISVSNNSIADWAKIRKRIIERDTYTCRICGNGTEFTLNVHHKDWDRKHNYDSNLVTLCGDCHRAIHKEGYKPILFEDWPEPWGNDP